MITKISDVRSIRPIAENVNDQKRLVPYISESESIYLKPMLGAAIYEELDIYVNATDPDVNAIFDLLLAGGYYTVNGVRMSFEGLKKAMGYLVFSRFFKNQNVNVTAFGVVQKTSEFSDPTDERTTVRVANDAEAIGLKYLDQCFEYLRAQSYFESSDNAKKVSNRKFQIIGE